MRDPGRILWMDERAQAQCMHSNCDIPEVIHASDL